MNRIESSWVIILHLSSFHYGRNCAVTKHFPNAQLLVSNGKHNHYHANLERRE